MSNRIDAIFFSCYNFTKVQIKGCEGKEYPAPNFLWGYLSSERQRAAPKAVRAAHERRGNMLPELLAETEHSEL